MPNSALLRSIALSLTMILLAACGTVPPSGGGSSETSTGEQTTEGPTTPPVETTTAPQPDSSNPAVVALLDSAHQSAGAGQLATATASLERALRIEPRNPKLWHELAKLKLQKGDYQQAESLAARSNAWAGTNRALRASNWRLISEARSMRGDNDGARTALETAKSFERE